MKLITTIAVRLKDGSNDEVYYINERELNEEIYQIVGDESVVDNENNEPSYEEIDDPETIEELSKLNKNQLIQVLVKHDIEITKTDKKENLFTLAKAILFGN